MKITPNPSSSSGAATAITETSGPTTLTVGTVADGQFLKRVGTTLVSAAGSADQLGLTPTAVKTSAYGAAAGDFVPVDTTSSAVTVTLPTAPTDGSIIAVKHVTQGGTNTVTVACGGSDVFNKTAGATSATLTLLAQAILVQYKATGAIWYVVSDDLPLSQLDARYPAGSGTSTGTNTGDQTTVSGNAGTATKLATARTIDGQSFDGSANITLIAEGTHAATSKTTPVAADEIPLVDSAASNVLKKLTWANLKTAVLAFTLDTFAAPAANVAMNAKKITGLGLASASTDAASLANTLDQFGAPAANVAMNAHKLTGLAAPTAAGDAVSLGNAGIVIASGVGTAVTGTLTETSLSGALAIAAGLIGINGYVKVEFEVFRPASETSSITWNVRFGATGSGTGGTVIQTTAGTITQLSGRLLATFYNNGSASSQRALGNSLQAGFAMANGASTTPAINTANASEINITATLGNTGDHANLGAYVVTVYPHS